jgi:hypothetical protein
MALIFSESFDYSFLLESFWPAAGRVGTRTLGGSQGRTNLRMGLPQDGTNISTDPANPANNSYVTLNLAEFGAQGNKKIFLGFASRHFKTRSGATDGTDTTRQPFVRLLDAVGATIVSFEFEKNQGTEDKLRLVAVQGNNIVARYFLNQLSTLRRQQNNSGDDFWVGDISGAAAWSHFEFEFDLTENFEIKLWVNGNRVQADNSGLTNSLAEFTSISQIRFFGNTTRDVQSGTSYYTLFDDLYLSDNLPAAFGAAPGTALTARLGGAKIFSGVFSSTTNQFTTTNWSAVPGGSAIGGTTGVLASDDGNASYVASAVTDAELKTVLPSVGTLSAFERIAAVQMIYSASAGGSEPVALMPVLSAAGTAGEPLAAAPTVFDPDDGYKMRVVIAQTDVIADTGFVTADVNPTATSRRIGLKLVPVPDND